MATSFFGGSFFGGEFFNTPSPTPSGRTPSGVRSKKGRKRELLLNLKDIENREDTAEFLKAQLKLRHPDSAFEEEKPANVFEDKARELREKQMRDSAAKAAKAFAAEKLAAEEAARKQIEVDTYNENVRILMLIAASRYDA